MEIKICKGNSRTLIFKSYKKDGTPNLFDNSKKFVFTVKQNTAIEKEIIRKEFIGDGTNAVTISLTQQDTNIACGSYKYDLHYATINKTVIEPQELIIAEVAHNVGY